MSCFINYATINFAHRYKLTASDNFDLFFIKVVMTSALHMLIYPEIAHCLEIFKYTVNQTDLFDPSCRGTVQFVAMFSLLINFAGELINVYNLMMQHTIDHTIIHAVALYIIIELPKIYMRSLGQDKLKHRIFQTPLVVQKRGSEIKFRDRPFKNKVYRSFYRICRILYSSVIFYFEPFFALILYRNLSYSSGHH